MRLTNLQTGAQRGGNRLIRDGKALRIGVIAAYLLMAVGSVVSV